MKLAATIFAALLSIVMWPGLASAKGQNIEAGTCWEHGLVAKRYLAGRGDSAGRFTGHAGEADFREGGDSG